MARLLVFCDAQHANGCSISLRWIGAQTNFYGSFLWLHCLHKPTQALWPFFGEPEGKKWVPPILRRASDEDLDRIEPFVSSITSHAGEPVAVLAWNVLTSRVWAARRVDETVTDYVVALLNRQAGEKLPFDWFEYLGLSRES